MPTEAEYEARIARYNWDDLIELWTQIESGYTPGWEPGKALEYLILRAFQLEGAEVIWPFSIRIYGTEIEQIDGVVYSDGLSCVIECKDMAEPANIEPIAKQRNQLLRRPAATIGSVFSRNGFTEPALLSASFIAPQTVLLWGGDEIAYALRNRCLRRGLIKKYRFCVERGLADYNIQEGGL